MLATPVVEKLRKYFPQAELHFLVRKGNESLLDNHPLISKVLVWDKKRQKIWNLLKVIFEVHRSGYDLVVNLQRFFSSGLITALSGSRYRACFSQNPLAVFANHRKQHQIGEGSSRLHEIQRNLSLIQQWTDNHPTKPKLYPSRQDFDKVQHIEKYITVSPASIWFTKQFPKEKWLSFLDRVGEGTTVFLLGGSGDRALCAWLSARTIHPKTIVKAGDLSFLEAAALMAGAKMNFVNDSAPLHFASAMNAPVTATFCSTIPSFGFWPLSDNALVLETDASLACRPCGLHGKKSCPEGHFNCADIAIERLLARIQ